jgi:hypothetical protein
MDEERMKKNSAQSQSEPNGPKSTVQSIDPKHLGIKESTQL